MMNSMWRAVMAAAVLMASSGLELTAQEGPPRERGPRVRGDVGVESIMSMRERLELKDDQVAQLDAIRAENVAERNAFRSEMTEMQSRLRAGQIRRSEIMAFMEERQDGRVGVAEARRDRIDGILEPEQRASLEQLRAESRAFQRGRQSGRREAGMAGRGPGDSERGFRRGPRGGDGALRPDGRRPRPRGGNDGASGGS